MTTLESSIQTADDGALVIRVMPGMPLGNRAARDILDHETTTRQIIRELSDLLERQEAWTIAHTFLGIFDDHPNLGEIGLDTDREEDGVYFDEESLEIFSTDDEIIEPDDGMFVEVLDVLNGLFDGHGRHVFMTLLFECETHQLTRENWGGMLEEAYARCYGPDQWGKDHASLEKNRLDIALAGATPSTKSPRL
jgi:hypothetical protein